MSKDKNMLMPVQFHNDTIFCLEHNGEPYTPVKPIIENLGISWGTQGPKLSSDRERFGCIDIKIPTNGGMQDALCLPVRKLAAFLYTINPNKVRPDLKDKLIQYQNECDDVLWQYWTKGYAASPKVKLTLKEEVDLASYILGLAGIRDNQLAIALDNLCAKRTGQSMLALTDTQLEAPTASKLYTPTELGQMADRPISARAVNAILRDAGLQFKSVKGQWELTPDGLDLGAVYLDVGKRHHDGAPVRQIKWPYLIMELIDHCAR